jgi:hypothetical protein
LESDDGRFQKPISVNGMVPLSRFKTKVDLAAGSDSDETDDILYTAFNDSKNNKPLKVV